MLAILSVVAVLAVPAAAADCAPFTHVQTYRGWGPARSYDRDVTVVYAASRCSGVEDGQVVLEMSGTATVFPAGRTSGPTVDVRGFEVSGTWAGVSNPSGWPPAWWRCDVARGTLAWDIPGVYSFTVSVRSGTWTVDVTADGARPQSVHWVHDACA